MDALFRCSQLGITLPAASEAGCRIGRLYPVGAVLASQPVPSENPFAVNVYHGTAMAEIVPASQDSPQWLPSMQNDPPFDTEETESDVLIVPQSEPNETAWNPLKVFHPVHEVAPVLLAHW
jgi:hypothetical protein